MRSISKVFYDLCHTADSAVSLGAWLRYQYAPQELATMAIDPAHYNDPASFARDYACVSFLRKYRGLDTGIDLVQTAIFSFRQAEEKCAVINARLRNFRLTGTGCRTELVIFERARKLIRKAWGAPTFGDLFDRCDWGPGATSSLKSPNATREHKMSEFPIRCTPTAAAYYRAVHVDNLAYLRHILGCDVGGPTSLLDSAFSFESSSRVITVPKDAKTDRTIAAEPTGNIYLQKGIGGYLRDRLRRLYGIDLNDQSVNQHLAQRAFVDELATLDLSAASDSISIEVVKLLCPDDMFAVLDRTRSPAYELEGEVKRFHKLSSMGNGFTFELESLLFYAIARSVVEFTGQSGSTGVYGDDIIVPRHAAAKLIDVLDELGFSVNAAKSYVDGCFFESCGKHFFEGVDVTPPFQKRIIREGRSGHLEYIRCHNRLRSWMTSSDLTYLGFPAEYGKITSRMFHQVDAPLRRCVGFDWMEGDGFFRRERPELRYHLNRGYELIYLQQRKPRRLLADGGLFADCLRKSSGAKRTVISDRCTWTDPARSDSAVTLFSPVGETQGFVDVRPREEVTSYTKATRWVRDHIGTVGS